MKSILTITGLDHTFKVAGISYGFNQMIDGSGRPTSEVLLQPINLSVYPEYIDDQDTTTYCNDLFIWMISNSKAYDGKVEYYQSENETSPMKTLAFTGAFCTDFNESFAAVSGERILHNITIVAATLEITPDGGDAVKYTNMWRKNA